MSRFTSLSCQSTNTFLNLPKTLSIRAASALVGLSSDVRLTEHRFWYVHFVKAQ